MKRIHAYYARGRRVRVPGLPDYDGIAAAVGTTRSNRGYMLIACDDGQNREIALHHVRFALGTDPPAGYERDDALPDYSPLSYLPIAYATLCDTARENAAK